MRAVMPDSRSEPAVILRTVVGWLLAGLGAIVLVQVLVALAPGDAIDTLPDPALRGQLAREWRLDDPTYLRVVLGTLHALSGAWGSSWTVRPGAPVWALVMGAMGSSMVVLLPAWFVAVGVGLLGRGRAAVALVSALPVVILSLGTIESVNALVWVGITSGWWSRPSFFALPAEGGLVRDLLMIGVLGIGSAAAGEVAARLGETDAALDQAGFVLATRARGGSVRGLLWRHRAVPLLEAAQAVFAPLTGGLVIVERLWGRPGVGDLLWRAVEARDVPVATGVIVVLASMTVLVGVTLDLCRRAWDPRLRILV